MHASAFNHRNNPSLDKKVVLTKALIKMAERLNLSRREISIIIRVSESTLSRIFSQSKFGVDPETNEGQLAILLIRLYRSLDTLFGGNQQQCQQWLRSYNKHLKAIPIDMIQSIEGLVLAVQYLDAMRGKI